MKGIIAAALLTLPLSLFAQGGAEGGAAPAAGTTATPAAATTTAPAATPAPAAMTMVTCVGSKGSALTEDQKKAIMAADTKVTSKAIGKWKAADVASADKCDGKFTIENGVATKVMHKKAMHHKK